MNKLIFPLILLSLNLHAAPQEIVDPNDAKSFVGQIYDLEIEDMLTKTKEFSGCRDKYKFEPNASDDERTKKLKEAEKCIKDSMATDKKALEKLSNKLNLQHYGLTKSKSVQDLQKYLNDKMYKSMTGVSLEESNRQKLAEDLKFGKRKMIDQGIFIQMYKTQLGKNALHEISRFCFENFRLENNPNNGATSFAEYWKTGFKENLTVNEVNDQGYPAFGRFNDPTDKDAVYADIFNSIQNSDGTLTKPLLEKFFMTCGKLIPELCKKYQVNLNNTESAVNKTPGNNLPTLGASACLAKSRIQEYRKTLSLVDKYAEEFKKMEADDKTMTIVLSGLNGTPLDLKFFGDGKDPNEESIDDLTNFTSKDLIEGGYSKDELAEKKAKECQERPEISTCEGFVFTGDKFEKAKHQVELELTLKREVEMARVRKIVEDNRSDIKTYLEENGHMDILKDVDQLSPDEIAKRVGESYEAKKLAILEQMNLKLGSRQVKKNSDGEEQVNAQSVSQTIQDNKEERARLAQVVLFNNIITSHISLKKKDGSDAGRNVGAWKKEEGALKDAKVDESLFANLKTTDEDKGIGKDAQIAGFGILDEILGKEPENPNGNGNSSR